MPIIFACDETKIGSMGKAGCWPLMFTTTILNQSMRNKSIAWKPLGYIYDLSTVLSQNQEKDGSVTLKSRRLHKMFDVILETFIEAQDNCLNDIEVTLGVITKKVNYHVSLSLETWKVETSFVVHLLCTLHH